METTNNNTERRVWVGCLACYNGGSLNGTWTSPARAIEWKCSDGAGGDRVDDVGEHEETWVFDHEGFGAFLTGECSPAIASAADILLTEMEDAGHDLGAVAAFLSNEGETLPSLDLERFEEAFCGEWDDEQDYARNLAEDIGAIDDDARWPAYCIDWERAADELFMDDYWSAPAPGGGVYVFQSV